MKKYKKSTNIKKENHSFWASVIYGLEKLYRFRAICKEKTQVFMGKVFLNQEKNAIFPFHQNWKENICQVRDNF